MAAPAHPRPSSNIYIAEPRVFQTASKKQAKLIIWLLDRLAVSNENDALM